MKKLIYTVSQTQLNHTESDTGVSADRAARDAGDNKTQMIRASIIGVSTDRAARDAGDMKK